MRHGVIGGLLVACVAGCARSAPSPAGPAPPPAASASGATTTRDDAAPSTTQAAAADGGAVVDARASCTAPNVPLPKTAHLAAEYRVRFSSGPVAGQDGTLKLLSDGRQETYVQIASDDGRISFTYVGTRSGDRVQARMPILCAVCCCDFQIEAILGTSQAKGAIRHNTGVVPGECNGEMRFE